MTHDFPPDSKFIPGPGVFVAHEPAGKPSRIKSDRAFWLTVSGGALGLGLLGGALLAADLVLVADRSDLNLYLGHNPAWNPPPVHQPDPLAAVNDLAAQLARKMNAATTSGYWCIGKTDVTGPSAVPGCPADAWMTFYHRIQQP